MIWRLPGRRESYIVPGIDAILRDEGMMKIATETNDAANEMEMNDGKADREALVPEPLTSAQIEDLKARAAKADENWDRLLRTTADMENFKKRAARDREEAVRYANETLIKKIVPVLDNFDMAMAAAAQNQSGDAVQSLQAGVTMIHQQLRKVLQEAGLEEVDATGKPFDPNLHEAVSQQETADVPEGQVLQQLRMGYKLRDRLVRPATVVVAKKPAA
jgi:molecular chaperone GrpE